MTPQQEKKFDHMYETVIRMETDVADIKTSVFGNGREGLTDRVTKVETKLKTGRGNIQLAISIVIAIVAVISMLITIKTVTGA